MPTYTLKDTTTNHQWDTMCTWDELQMTLDEMPELVQVMSAPKIVGGVGNLHSKVPDGFKDVLSRVKTSSSKNNTINN
tara:strand:+ start:1766 stop:1999 length:234 start_codon:yes stop_codon:yes gene_type:complete